MKIAYTSVSNADEAFTKVKAVVTPEYTQKFGVKADTSYDEANKAIVAKGKGFTMTITFEDDGAAIDLELGFMLKALAGPVLKKIEAEIKTHL